MSAAAHPLSGNRANDSRRGSPWRLLPLGLLLAVSIYLRLTDVISVSFEPGWFVVLLAGWMADRYGPRAAIGVAAVGVPYVSWQPGTFDVYWGFPTDALLLAAFATLAFGCTPLRMATGLAPALRSHWRVGVWVALLVLALAAFASLHYYFEVTPTFSVEWSVGALPILAALAATVRWNVVRERYTGRSALLVLVAVLFAAALLARISFRTETVVFGLALSEMDRWLLAVCFALCAFRVVDWRTVLGLLAVAFLADLAAWRIEPDLTPMLAAAGGIDPSDSFALRILGFDTATAWTSLVNCASAALLGVVLSPFWCDRQIAPLRTARSIVLLGVVLALQFVAVPAWQGEYLSWDLLVLGGLAYTLGLIGRGQAVFAGPLLISTCAFLAVAAFGEPSAWFSSYASQLPRIGPIVFVFGFFGVLSNRYEHARASAQRTPAAGAVEAVP